MPALMPEGSGARSCSCPGRHQDEHLRRRGMQPRQSAWATGFDGTPAAPALLHLDIEHKL